VTKKRMKLAHIVIVMYFAIQEVVLLVALMCLCHVIAERRSSDSLVRFLSVPSLLVRVHVVSS
jgi:hypothetical protein